MRLLVLFDLAEPPPPVQEESVYADDLKDESWESEAAVLSAARALGFEVQLFGICDDARPLVEKLESWKPDAVFNLAEAYRRDRALEPHIAGLLELLGARYTGASASALALCKDKALAKKLVALEGVRVPRSALSPRAQPLRKIEQVVFPAIVKPVGLESSTGIAQSSFVESELAALERARFVHEKLGQDALVEEYIEGRELYLSLLGRWDGKLEIFPARELFFAQVPEGDPKFLTYKAKWDDAYRAKWGIRNGFARLSEKVAGELEVLAAKVSRALRLSGYARLDLRLTPEGELVFLEANPNPSLSPKDDYAAAAAKAGLSYEKLVSRIVKLAVKEAGL